MEADTDVDYMYNGMYPPAPAAKTAASSARAVTMQEEQPAASSEYSSSTTTKKKSMKASLNHQLSMPSRHQDPFAVREGKTLVWKDVNMTLVRFLYDSLLCNQSDDSD